MPQIVQLQDRFEIMLETIKRFCCRWPSLWTTRLAQIFHGRYTLVCPRPDLGAGRVTSRVQLAQL